MKILNKNSFLLLGLLVLIIVVVIIILSINVPSKPQSKPPPPVASPTTYEITAPAGESNYKGVQQIIDPRWTALMDNVSFLTTSLLNKQYDGAHFSFSYNISTNDYILYLDKNFQNEGKQEFQNYLKQFSLSTDLLKKAGQTIKTYIKQPSPTPAP